MKKTDYIELKNWTKNYISDNCIVRNTVMPGKAPGSTYTWMFYLRRGLFNHEFLSAVSQLFIHELSRIDPKLNFQISGLETAATPMLAGIPLIGRAMDLNINSFVVRKEQKEYGLMNWIEGIPNKKPVLILDDLCNSSASMAKCYNILKAHNLQIYPYAFCIVNKSNRQVHDQKRLNSDMYLPSNIKVLSLFTLDDFGLYNPSH
jgi:orotate phosphoribosyltransferase